MCDVAPALRRTAGQYSAPLLRPGIARAVAVRPAPEVWSAQEYCCHVRDVLLIQRDRVLLALVEEVPSFSRMYRDERAALAGYRHESIAGAVQGLAVAADLLARIFDGLTPAQLGRRCVYNYPSAAVRDVAWLGRHSVHEAGHHLGDVRSVLARVVPGGP